MSWSPQQDKAKVEVADWLADPNGKQVFRMFGFAGTGKTTLAQSFANDCGHVLFGAFTGKAAHVMHRKGCLGASTIHSLIYKIKESPYGGEPEFVLNRNSDVSHASLVVIDECSMVGQELGEDLLSFGTRVLVIGDPAQLPPVKGAGFFTDHKPDIMLTEVHRQARENPIIRLSMDVREGRSLKRGDHGQAKVLSAGQFDKEDVLSADQILVGLNRTRTSYNRRVRQLMGFSDYPYPKKGERLICLRNNREKHLLNGSMWDVVRGSQTPTKMGTLKIRVLPEDPDPKTKPRRVDVLPAFFDGTESELEWEDKRGTDEFTFGYTITVHKAQGSQWDSVFLFDEGEVFREHYARWLYTGITRAAETITIVQN